MAASFLTAEWKNLIMANYAIDPTVLLPWLPPKTELDTHDGITYISLVGFHFADTRLLGFKVPFHINFEEVNLRFYVKYKAAEGWRRGVVFIKEIVPKWAITTIANKVYSEKYQTMRMTRLFTEHPDDYHIGYAWKYKGEWNRLSAVTGKNTMAMQPGSKEEFIAEHYWGYSRHSASLTYEYQVEHPAWELYPVQSFNIKCDFGKVYGSPFSFLNDRSPDCVFVAKGSPICVRKKTRL